MSSFDFVVVGTGSGGGTAVRRLVESFPFSTVLALEAGKDLPTAADRRGDSLQSETDDKLDKTWPFWAEPVVTNYGQSHAIGAFGSPYGAGGALYQGDFTWTAPAFEQGMGKVVGGSSHHNGMMALRGSPEDYDEWDYALRDGGTKWNFGAADTITWAGAVVLACNFGAYTTVTAALATGRAVFIAASDDPSVHPPFRVISTNLAGPSITIAAGAETVPNTGGPVGTNVFCSMWNRARMLECYIAVENDIDSTAYPVNPNGVPSAVHGINGWTEIGRIGRRETTNAVPLRDWIDTRPGIGVPRQAQTQLEIMESLTFSAATDAAWAPPTDGLGGNTLPYLSDFNGWTIRIPAGVAAPPWGRTWQIPLNYVGLSTGGQPVAGGHHVAKIGRYDKYDERRSTLLTSVDPVRNLVFFTATYGASSTAVIPGNGELTVGGALAGASGAGTITAADVRTEVFYGAAGAPADPGVSGALITAPGGKSGVVLSALPTQTGEVRYTVALDAATPPFVGGDLATAGTAPPTPPFSIKELPASPDPVVTQRVQVNVASGSFNAGDPVTQAGAFAGNTASAATPCLTLVDYATVDKVNMEPSAGLTDLWIQSPAPFGAPPATPAVGQYCLGLTSGTEAVVVEANANVTLADQAWIRVRAISGPGFVLGETVDASGPGWQGVTRRVDPVLQATGVVYFKADDAGKQQRYTVSSSNIVLGAGPFNTPAILQRSGVGALDRLSPAGVKQILDLAAVGDRACQHTIWTPFVWYMNAVHDSDKATYVLQMADLYRSSQDRSVVALRANNEVPGSTLAVWEVGANNPSGPLLFDQDFDTIGIIIGNGVSAEAGFASATGGYGLSSKRVNAGPQMQAAIGNPFGVYTQGRLAILSLANFKPRSRGRGVFIQSDSAFDLPVIDHGIVSDYRSKDAEALLEHADQAFAKLTDGGVPAGFAALSTVGFSFPFVTPPSPVGGGLQAQRVAQVVQTMTAAYHVIGTCAMGPDTDAAVPLDERARLRHVVGVRVVDTSIMPTHVRANPHLPTVAGAYNVVSMIAEDGGC